jgi:type IV fimbrial biogenesis protein FimT
MDRHRHHWLKAVMHATAPIVRAHGVTLIELMTVIAIMAILLAVAVPSFSSFLSKRRVENALTELTTDLQFARSEAAQRNVSVRITFGTGCYVVHTVGSTATSCTQAGGASLGTGAVEVKTVKLETGSVLSFRPNNTLTYLMFDSVRGMATWDGTGTTSGSVDITSSAGSWQLRASVTPVGRTKACSPNASVAGYSSTSCN